MEIVETKSLITRAGFGNSRGSSSITIGLTNEEFATLQSLVEVALNMAPNPSQLALGMKQDIDGHIERSAKYFKK